MVDLENAQQFLMTRGMDFGLKVIAAISLWIVDRWLIRLATRLLSRLVQRSGKADTTLAYYMSSVVSVLLTIVLILAILQVFGVQTTSFAALLAGASASRSARPGAACSRTSRRACSCRCCIRSRWAIRSRRRA
ncbi:MAG: hypothetical protein GAK41_00116 [Burkholderia gladioli]|nr:MAG: hypothetical protein GAK41_00116 [Burkholderia gladioli]